MKRTGSSNPRLRWRYALKVLARSRSFEFMRNAALAQRSASLAQLRWGGRDISYRPGTSDPFVLYQVLLKTGRKAEYYVPPALKPGVIVDIGSNIGGSILYFHRLFPRARIFGFEPHPETFEILQRNVADLPGVTLMRCGLGETNATETAPASSNFSSFRTQGDRPPADAGNGGVRFEIRHAGEVFRELGINQVDLLKIDCEGSEAAIFRALPDSLLHTCRWIVGEMHDASGFEILARLAPHFDLDLKKRMFSASFRFHACNLSSAPALRRTFDRQALQV